MLGFGPLMTLPLLFLPPATAIPPATTQVGGHFIPLTKEQLKALQKKTKQLNDAEIARRDTRRKDRDDITQEILETIYPKPKVAASINPTENDVISADDEDEDLELILFHS